MKRFADVPEQLEAKRLLVGALDDGRANAFLFHGPAGVGKRTAAGAFAAALLGDARRVAARTHPDLVVVEALGEMIRIDSVRALHHDLHMRPFEAARRVYLLFDAHLLNDDAADALLKDLEEPPSYATIVLVADELGPMPETIRSRCQLVPFRRLSEQAVREWLAARAPELSGETVTAYARVAAGRLDRARRLLDPAARERREALIAAARAPYLAEAFDPAGAAGVLLEGSAQRAAEARAREEELIAEFDLAPREAEQRVKRVARGAEREELLAQLEELTAWYRDLVVLAAGAGRAVAHADHQAELDADLARGLAGGPERAATVVRATWRTVEEFNVNPSLALEALFVRVHGAFA